MNQKEIQYKRELLARSDSCSKTVIVNTANALLEEVERLNEVIRRTVEDDNKYIKMLRERCAPK